MPLEEIDDGPSPFENEHQNLLKEKIFAHILWQNPVLEWRVLHSRPVKYIDQRIKIVSHMFNQQLDDILQTDDYIEKMSYTLEGQIFIRDTQATRSKYYGEDVKNERRIIRLNQGVVINAVSCLNKDERQILADGIADIAHEEYVTGLEEKGEFELTPLLETCINDMHDAIMNATFTPIHTGKGLFRIIKHHLQNFIYSVLIVCKKQGKWLHASIASYTGVSRKHSNQS